MWGITEDQLERPPVPVWPENRQAVIVFLTMRTQWRVGMAGRTGLDYSALPEVWRRTKTPLDDRDECFELLRVLEVAAINANEPEDD